MLSPHRSALLAARERLAILERERVARPRCEACAARRRNAARRVLGVLTILGAAAILGLLFVAPVLFFAAAFDTSGLGR